MSVGSLQVLACCDACVTIFVSLQINCPPRACSCSPWEVARSGLLCPPLAVGPCLLHLWVDLVHVLSQASHWGSWPAWPGVPLLELRGGWSPAGWEASLSWKPLWALSALSYEVGLGKYGPRFITGRVLCSWGGHVCSTYCASGLTQLFSCRNRLEDSSAVFLRVSGRASKIKSSAKPICRRMRCVSGKDLLQKVMVTCGLVEALIISKPSVNRGIRLPGAFPLAGLCPLGRSRDE